MLAEPWSLWRLWASTQPCPSQRGGLLAVLGGPWLVAALLLCQGHLLSVCFQVHLPSVCVHLCVQISPSHKLDWSPSYWPHFDLMISGQTLFPNQVVFWGTRGWDFNMSVLRGHTIQPETVPGWPPVRSQLQNIINPVISHCLHFHVSIRWWITTFAYVTSSLGFSCESPVMLLPHSVLTGILPEFYPPLAPPAHWRSWMPSYHKEFLSSAFVNSVTHVRSSKVSNLLPSRKLDLLSYEIGDS